MGCSGGCAGMGNKPSGRSTYTPKSSYKPAAAKTYSSGRPTGYNPFATGSNNFGQARVRTSFGRNK